MKTKGCESLTVLAFCFLLVNLPVSAEPRLRPVEWGQPVINSSLKNWYQVDDKVFRSEQPNKREMQELEAFGIRTVLNLRRLHSDDGEAKNTSLELKRVKMSAGKITVAQVTEALKILRDAEGSVLVHCAFGSDRTGAVIAAYRIVVHGWSKAEAIDELLHGGYGFHRRYDNIPRLIEETDWAAVRGERHPKQEVESAE